MYVHGKAQTCLAHCRKLQRALCCSWLCLCLCCCWLWKLLWRCWAPQYSNFLLLRRLALSFKLSQKLIVPAHTSMEQYKTAQLERAKHDSRLKETSNPQLSRILHLFRLVVIERRLRQPARQLSQLLALLFKLRFDALNPARVCTQGRVCLERARVVSFLIQHFAAKDNHAPATHLSTSRSALELLSVAALCSRADSTARSLSRFVMVCKAVSRLRILPRSVSSCDECSALGQREKKSTVI